MSLIRRLRIILITISCFKKIDVKKFSSYCLETAKLFIELYPWFNMPASLHRLLIHGADIIASFNLPIGCFSEEGAEARNKHYRNDRLNHARKDTKAHNMEDMINKANESSDPQISEMHLMNRLKTRKKLSLPPEVVSLLEEKSNNDDEFSESDLENIFSEIDF